VGSGSGVGKGTPGMLVVSKLYNSALPVLPLFA
jgi:hypothetical protein